MRSIAYHRARVGLAACALALLPRAAMAQSRESSGLTAPALSEPQAPRDPRPEGPQPRAGVEVELEIDRAGQVTNARVIRADDPSLEGPALDTARALRFHPATRDGSPIPARIRFEVVFAERAAPPPTATPAAEEAPAKPSEAATPPGAAPASGPSTPSAEDEPSFEATARVDAPPREPTKYTLSNEELTRAAGTRGDPLRAIELLPGVGRPGGGPDGAVILRGANPVDSQVFIEGAPAPYLYHVGGLTSVVHGRVLEAVDLYPSNFSVRYGRKVGGVVEARLRDPRTDKLHGIADVSLLDSSLLVETPLGDKVSILAAARRSNIDAVLNTATNNTDLAITAAPVYWDYQSVAAWKPTERDRLRIVAYGSSDQLALLLKNPADADPAIRGTFDQRTTFHRVQLGYRHRYAGGSETNTELTYGRLHSLGQFGALGKSTFDVDTLQARSELTSVLSSHVRLVAGVDILSSYFSGGYEGIPPQSSEGDRPLNFATQKRVRVDAATWVHTPGAYLEAGVRPVSNLLLTPGIRVDYNDLIDRASADPRFSGRYEITPGTTLKGGLGRYSQAPLEQESVDPIGNPQLRMTKATHASAGVEQALGNTVTASVEGFAKWLDGVVSATPGGRAPFFENRQRGRIFGGELALRLKPTSRFFGFLSYTLSRSERRDQDATEWRLFDRDMTHMLAASGSLKLGRGWEVGSSFRYSSGAPYTPVVSSTYEATADVYQPRLGAPMTARNPPFYRLDARVEKKWTFSVWSLAVYLDVQNVTNAPNRDGFNYSYDYRRREGARGLPILPILGLRGEL